jgi:hypothetical protein
MQQLNYKNANGVLLHAPCRDVKNKGQIQLLELSSVQELVKIEPESVKLKILHC